MEFTIGYVCGAVMMVVAYAIIRIAVKNNNKIKDKETSKSDKANNNEAKGTFTLPDITKMALKDVIKRKEYLETVAQCMRLLDAESIQYINMDIAFFNPHVNSDYLKWDLLLFRTEDATFKKYFLDAIYKFVQDYKQSIESKQDNQPTKSDDNQ